MVQDQQITPEQQGYPSSRDPIYLRDWCRHPRAGGVFSRISMIRQAAQTIHQLWRNGYELHDFSPLLWRFEPSGSTYRLSVPSHLAIEHTPLTLDQLTRRFAHWRLETMGLVSNTVSLAFMIAFLKWEPLGSGRASSYLQEIEQAARRNQPDVLRDTLDRYAQRQGSSDTTAATAAYLHDLTISSIPGPSHLVTTSADVWLSDALAADEDWYGMIAKWHRLLRTIQQHGFQVTRQPLLHAIKLSRPQDNTSPWHLWIDPTALSPQPRRWFLRPPPLSHQLEQEIHRLRTTSTSR